MSALLQYFYSPPQIKHPLRHFVEHGISFLMALKWTKSHFY